MTKLAWLRMAAVPPRRAMMLAFGHARHQRLDSLVAAFMTAVGESVCAPIFATLNTINDAVAKRPARNEVPRAAPESPTIETECSLGATGQVTKRLTAISCNRQILKPAHATVVIKPGRSHRHAACTAIIGGPPPHPPHRPALRRIVTVSGDTAICLLKEIQRCELWRFLALSLAALVATRRRWRPTFRSRMATHGSWLATASATPPELL